MTAQTRPLTITQRSLPLSRKPYGLLLDLRNVPHDLGTDVQGMAFTPNHAVPLKHNGAGWESPHRPDILERHPADGPQLWPRHQHERDYGLLRSGVLLYLSPTHAYVKLHEHGQVNNVALSEGVLFTPEGNFQCVCEDDDDDGVIYFSVNTVPVASYDVGTAEFHEDEGYQQAMKLLKKQGRIDNEPPITCRPDLSDTEEEA